MREQTAARPLAWLQSAVILTAIFLDLFGFGMIIPDLQFRAERLGATGWVIGAILASTFAVQTLVSPGWGRLSDRVGRKPILVFCSLLSGAGLLMYGLAHTLAFILLSRVLSGLGGANVSTAQAYIADVTLPAERTLMMGRLGAAVSSGLIAGSAASGAFGKAFPLLNVGLLSAAASLAGAALLAVFLQSGPNVTVEHVDTNQMRQPKRGPLVLLTELPNLRPLVLVAIIAWFSLATLEGTFGRLIERTLSLGRPAFGAIFAYESFLGVLIQGLLLVWVTRRYPDSAILRVAYVLQGLGLALTPFAPHLAMLFAFSTLYALGAGLAGPTINGLCSRLTPDSRQGELFGILQGTRSVGFIIGPIIGGWMFDRYAPSPYLLAGGTCLFASLLVRNPGGKN